jgi:hypothetical protein
LILPLLSGSTFITSLVTESAHALEETACNEYLVTENRILRSKIKGQLRLKDEERRQLATIGKQLGRKALAAVATIVKPDTILRWHAKLIARKFDGSRYRRFAGRPPLSTEIEAQILRFAHENKNWGYDRISGALKNLGHRVSDKTIANVLRKHGLPTVNERKKETTWREFVRNHMDVLVCIIRGKKATSVG